MLLLPTLARLYALIRPNRLSIVITSHVLSATRACTTRSSMRAYDGPLQRVLSVRQDDRAFCASCKGRGPNDYVCTKCNEQITGAIVSALGTPRPVVLSALLSLMRSKVARQMLCLRHMRPAFQGWSIPRLLWQAVRFFPSCPSHFRAAIATRTTRSRRRA